MNRIVLIGNGFDLVHGLPTRYEDFIKAYWEGFMYYCIGQDSLNSYGEYKYDCMNLKFLLQGDKLSNHLPDADPPYRPPFKETANYNELIEFVKEYNKQLNNNVVFDIDNKFITHLLEISNVNKSWVDIENEYYKYLIYQFDRRKNNGYYYGNVNTLNNDFAHIKEKLNEYLTKIINNTEIQKSVKIWDVIYSGIDLKDFTEKGQESIATVEYWKVIREIEGVDDGIHPGINPKTRPLMEDYSHYSRQELKEQILYDLRKEEIAKENFDLKLDNVLFLNFNYTDTEKHYSSNVDFEIETIHIHGELNNPDNPIIFGYGDELEENYSKLENLNNNAYLENIKSINYQETDNYKQMLNFINSDQYQVIILGHSCGNSDRTLLNTLFEHENCVSIKPYYYQYKDEKTGEIKDNYSDIVRNISRSFTDKKSMRDKVVNKTYTDWFSQKLD